MTQALAARATIRRRQHALRATYVVPRQHDVELPDARTRHLLSRFSAGPSASHLADVKAAGGAGAWFEQQLTPKAIQDHKADACWSWYPSLALTPLQKWQAAQAGQLSGWQLSMDLAAWLMMRRLVSKRAVEEMMVDFWSNLLHVACPAPNAWLWRVEYEETVRSHALGRFVDLLRATISHPAMGLYLNNVDSTATAMNENLGRELLECFTVGAGEFGQHDVVNSARILTGFHVDVAGTWEASYVPADHWVGRVKVLDFTSPNAKQDGRPVLDRYLAHLARHPLTAQRVCGRLAVRFGSDSPSQGLVDSLAQTYLESDTDIRPVLQALVSSAEFLDSAMAKVKTPVEDAISTWNALAVTVAQPGSADDAANWFPVLGREMGQVLYDWSTPDAFPDLAPAWTSPGRLLGGTRVHWNASNSSLPSAGITYRTPSQWMPQLPTTFDHVVDSLVRKVLFLPCTPTMLQAACVCTGIDPLDMIDDQHPLLGPDFPRLMVTVLDSVEQLCR